MKYLLLIFPFLFLGCNEYKAYINHYDKKITHLPCLKLSTNDLILQMQLQPLYHFSSQCEYQLQAAKKSGIVCNSNQNADKKALTNFPHGFLRLDIYHNKKIVYSYYLDVDKAVTKKMVEDGFNAIKKEFDLP